jgi:hypothetical protein
MDAIFANAPTEPTVVAIQVGKIYCDPHCSILQMQRAGDHQRQADRSHWKAAGQHARAARLSSRSALYSAK